jgi:hypothetical protein
MQIQVAPKTFYFGAAISIGSGQDAVVTGTAGSIFDGRGENRLFIVVGGAKLTLRGLVLTNGYVSSRDDIGGGGLLIRGAYVKLENCRVTACYSYNQGGGLALLSSIAEMDGGSSIDGNEVLTTPQHFRAASVANAVCSSR